MSRATYSDAYVDDKVKAKPSDRDIIIMFEGGYSRSAMMERWDIKPSALSRLYQDAKRRQAAAAGKTAPLSGHGLQVANTRVRWLDDQDLLSLVRDGNAIACAKQAPMELAA